MKLNTREMGLLIAALGHLSRGLRPAPDGRGIDADIADRVAKLRGRLMQAHHESIHGRALELSPGRWITYPPDALPAAPEIAQEPRGALAPASWSDRAVDAVGRFLGRAAGFREVN